MAPKRFENQDMAEAQFLSVNLYKARFDDVNLAEVTIHNANLQDVTINDANIRGMTIMGIRVDALIESELDRRDPVRGQLRMKDIHNITEVRRVMAELDKVRCTFVQYLKSLSPEVLNNHPAPGRWSALEHCRHLVFAEDLYLNRWMLRNNKPWSRLGYLPPFLEGNPDYAVIGTQPSDDLEVVLKAWSDIHFETQAYLETLDERTLRDNTSDIDFGQGTIGQVLQVMAQHDLVHIRMAEAAATDSI